jgi:flagellar motor switch protein FliM
MTITRYDFTRPPPLAPSLRAILSQWLNRSNALLVELLAEMSVRIELRFEDTSTIFPTEALSQWTDKSLAVQVVLDGHEGQSLIALPNPLAQGMVGQMLGEDPPSLPAERELTPAELSVAELVVELLVKSLNDSWQGDAGLGLSAGPIEPNLRRTRRFKPAEPVIVCRSIVRTSLGESHWCWLFSNEFLSQLFGVPTRAPRASDDQQSRRKLERLIGSMRTDVEVRLGGVQLTGPQLSNLRVGDVVVLDQRVSEPLRASVRGELKFLGWAGRVGNRQAFEVASTARHQHATEIADGALTASH